MMPPMASFAFRGTAREFTLYPFVALTPNDAGIAYIKVKLKPGTTNVVKLKVHTKCSDIKMQLSTFGQLLRK